MGVASLIYIKYAHVEGNLTLNDLCGILTQMPNGTAIESIDKLNTIGLVVRFQINLSNELFKNDTVIKDNQCYTRSIGFTEKGKLKEFNSSPVYSLEDVIRKHPIPYLYTDE